VRKKCLISAAVLFFLTAAAYGSGREPGTPLHEAVIANDIEKVRQLLDEGADVNIRTPYSKQTPLHWSVWQSDIAIMNLLIERGADVEARDSNEMTPLHLLSTSQKKERAGALLCLLGEGAQVNTVDKFGASPLHIAAHNNSADFVKILLEHGADIEMKQEEYGTTPLFTAVLSWKPGVESMAVLIGHGADVNARDETLRTPLFYAVTRADAERLVFLLEKGADINAQANDGETPLHNAVMQDDLVLAEILIGAGARINSRDSWGQTSLHRAVYYGKGKAVDLLIRRGADPNLADNKGKKPLDIAREKNAFGRISKEILDLLKPLTVSK